MFLWPSQRQAGPFSLGVHGCSAPALLPAGGRGPCSSPLPAGRPLGATGPPTWMGGGGLLSPGHLLPQLHAIF